MDYRIIDEVIGVNLKLKRIALSYTQQEFAEKLGVAQPTYSCYEKGTRSMPVDVFYKACNLLNVDPLKIAQEASEAYAKTFEK